MSGPDRPAVLESAAMTLAAAHPLSGNRTATLPACVPRSRSAPPLIAIIAILLYGCAPLEPQRPPEVRTQVVEVKIPVPIPCVTEADRPVLPPLTVVDIDRATVDQLAAALAADEANETLYRNAVDSLFIQCMRVTGSIK